MKAFILKFNPAVLRMLLLIALATESISCSKEVDVDPVLDKGIPTLLTPQPNETLDNGCLNKTDPIQWTFTWSSVLKAESYQLYVKNQDAQYPVIDQVLSLTHYESNTLGYIIPRNARNWKWKVRAMINGYWAGWSSERSFEVEPVQTDCPG